MSDTIITALTAINLSLNCYVYLQLRAQKRLIDSQEKIIQKMFRNNR